MVLILSTSQSIKYLFSCRLSISSIILLNSWTSFMLPTDLAVTCQLFCTAASIIAWRMENPVGEETIQPFKRRTKIKTILMFDKNLHHLKGHRLAESLQVPHCLTKQQCRDQFLLSAMPLAKSLAPAGCLGAASLQGISESVQYTRLWSSQGCLWSCWGLCQLRIGVCSHHLGRSPSGWGAGQKGWFACAECSNGSLTGRDPSTAQECQLSHCTVTGATTTRSTLLILTLISENVFNYGV